MRTMHGPILGDVIYLSSYTRQFLEKYTNMEANILADSASFYDLLNKLLAKIDEEELKSQCGRFREGGKIDLNVLGDSVWLDHFRSDSS